MASHVSGTKVDAKPNLSRRHEPITNLLSETLGDSGASHPIRNTLAAMLAGNTLTIPPEIASIANSDE